MACKMRLPRVGIAAAVTNGLSVPGSTPAKPVPLHEPVTRLAQPDAAMAAVTCSSGFGWYTLAS